MPRMREKEEDIHTLRTLLGGSHGYLLPDLNDDLSGSLLLSLLPFHLALLPRVRLGAAHPPRPQDRHPDRRSLLLHRSPPRQLGAVPRPVSVGSHRSLLSLLQQQLGESLHTHKAYLLALDTFLVAKAARKMIGVQRWKDSSGNPDRGGYLRGHHWTLGALLLLSPTRGAGWPGRC